MRIAILAVFLALAACQKAPPAAAPQALPATATPARHAGVQGWNTGKASYAMLGFTAPNFKAKREGGGELTQADLRGRWTILAFWGLWSDDSLADVRYIRALNTAADQDPDLDFLSVHTPPAPGRAPGALEHTPTLAAWFKENGGGWPTIVDADGKIAQAFAVDNPPVYLLIGPDLTIEAFRTDLSATPEDGIKPVMRGIAEIKKQIAAPE